jgi:hypothetical protein
MLLMVGATASSVTPGGTALLGFAALAWLAVLWPWLRRVDTLAPPAHQRRMYAALAAWALTDVAVLLAFR